MKILIVSDIHINDYPQKNPTEKYRLYQTRTVADNIINVDNTYQIAPNPPIDRIEGIRRTLKWMQQ